MKKASCPKCQHQIAWGEMVFGIGPWWDLSCPSCKSELKIDPIWQLPKIFLAVLLAGIWMVLGDHVSWYFRIAFVPIFLIIFFLISPYLTRYKIKK